MRPYNMYVRPGLEYCSFLFSLMRATERKKIESVQHFFTKRILTPEHRHLSYQERCRLTGLDPLWLRRLQKGLFLLFKLLYNHTFNPLTSLRHHNHPRRNSHREVFLFLPLARTVKYRRFFSVNAIAIWNKLPMSVKTLQNYPLFKRTITRFLHSEKLPQILGSESTDRLYRSDGVCGL